jgi:hypothetical protein
MKKTLLIGLLSLAMNVSAQIVVTPNPFNVNSGAITITYGPDYSLFDPLSDPNLFLYTGLETTGDTNWDLTDTWANTATLVPLTYNATQNKYVATVDIGTRTYTNNGSGNQTLSNGQAVNNWFFIIRNGAGNRQSGNLAGTSFGFQPTNFLSVSENGISKQDFTIQNGEISTNLSGATSVEIFNLLGQKMLNLNLNQLERKAIALQKNQIYIAVVSNQDKKGTFKFIN